MYPSVPGGLPRVTPKGGEVIGGRFIPEGVGRVFGYKAVYDACKLIICFLDNCWSAIVVNPAWWKCIWRAFWIQAREVASWRYRRVVEAPPSILIWSTYVCRQEVSNRPMTEAQSSLGINRFLYSLAMMEMTLTMAHLFRRYEVTLADPNETMPLIQTFIMKPCKLICKHWRNSPLSWPDSLYTYLHAFVFTSESRVECLLA